MPILTDVVDLSVPFYEGMPCDDLGPKIWDRVDYAYSRQLFNETQSRAGRVFFTTDHTGTHLDGPLRFNPAGMPLDELPLQRFILPARLLDLRSANRSRAIGPVELEAAGIASVQPGDAVALWTGHDRYLKNPDYFWNRPVLTAEGAHALARLAPGLVATDFPGIGPPSDGHFAVKRILHAAGAMTAEQLCNLACLSGRDWHLFAAPLRVRGSPGSLIRACALVEWAATELVDLTHEIWSGMPSLGAVPQYWPRASHRVTSHFHGENRSYHSHAMMLNEHAGTHFDSPYHFDEYGPAIDALPLQAMVYRAVIADMTHKQPLEGISATDLQAAFGRSGDRLGPGSTAVIRTGHDAKYGVRADFGSHRPFITADGADWLAAQQTSLVTTDLVGLDEPADVTEPVHNILLHAGICLLQVDDQPRPHRIRRLAGLRLPAEACGRNGCTAAGVRGPKPRQQADLTSTRRMHRCHARPRRSSCRHWQGRSGR